MSDAQGVTTPQCRLHTVHHSICEINHHYVHCCTQALQASSSIAKLCCRQIRDVAEGGL
jgi:hypothetical protein